MYLGVVVVRWKLSVREQRVKTFSGNTSRIPLEPALWNSSTFLLLGTTAFANKDILCGTSFFEEIQHREGVKKNNLIFDGLYCNLQ